MSAELIYVNIGPYFCVDGPFFISDVIEANKMFFVK